jgi:hypothetical protein
MPCKTIRILRIIYRIFMFAAILAFLCETLLILAKKMQPINNTGLEQWSIILTLASIFITIRLMYLLNKNNTHIPVKQYIIKYCAEFAILVTVFAFNAICFYFTGVKNFMFLAFICIFAMFLCAPNKRIVSGEIENQ